MRGQAARSSADGDAMFFGASIINPAFPRQGDDLELSFDGRATHGEKGNLRAHAFGESEIK